VAALYAWLRRHPKLVDGGLAAVLAFLGIASSAATGRLIAVPLVIALAVPVVFRRAYPVAAFAAAIAVGALQVLINSKPNPTDLAIVILLYTLAAYTPRRISITGLAICLAGSAAAVLRWMPGRLSMWDSLLVGSIMFAGPSLIAWVFGDSMRYRRRTTRTWKTGRPGWRRSATRRRRSPRRRNGPGSPASCMTWSRTTSA
jgi:hypothetical protein